MMSVSRMRPICRFCLVFFVFAGALASKTSELAHVAILKFSNETQNKDYEWVRTSLPDAINKSMHEKFEFIRTEDAKLAGFDRVVDPKDGASLADIAAKTGSDIVIFGKYGYAGNKDEIVITSYVYHIQGKRVIGESRVISKLDNAIFQQIDKIADQSVEHIYQFVLTASKEKKTGVTEQVRILVLVPTWSNAEEQKKAELEVDAIKGELSKQYQAKFLTLGEFYAEMKIPEAEQKKVNGYAAAFDKPRVVEWLAAHGVDDAFIIFVAGQKVNVTLIVAHKAQPEFSYPVAAKRQDKLKTIEVNTRQKGLELAAGSTTRLHKNLFAASGASALHVFTGAVFPAGGASQYLSTGFGFAVSYYRNFYFPWLYPVAQASFASSGGKTDGDFRTNFMSFSAGAGYPVWRRGRISVFSYLTFGTALVVLKSRDKTHVQFVTQAGGILDYEILPRLLLSVSISGGFLPETTRSTLLITAALGAGYRF
jgi:hypothetical protein